LKAGVYARAFEYLRKNRQKVVSQAVSQEKMKNNITFYSGEKLPIIRNLNGEYAPLTEALTILGVSDENMETAVEWAKECMTRFFKESGEAFTEVFVGGQGRKKIYATHIRIEALRELSKRTRLYQLVAPENRQRCAARREELHGRLFEYWFGEYERYGAYRGGGPLTSNTKYYRRTFGKKAA